MLLIWFLSTWVGWYTRRKSQPLLALAPATFTLAAGLYITRADPAPLIELCVAGLVLKTFSGNIHRWQDWQRARIPVVDIYFEWIGISLGVIIILSIGAAIAPSISVRQVARAVDQILHPPDAKEGPDYAASFGLQVRPKPVEVFENAQVSSLPARHLIGAGPELSQKVVMWVTIRGYYPASPQALAANPLLRPPRYYGRSLTYDRYTGRGWMSSPISYSSYQAGESVSWPAEALENYRTVEQQIRYSGDPDELVYAAGDLVTVDHSFLIGWRGDGDALGAHVVTPGYWAISRQPLANEALLRAAGWQYPGWVSERYLSLPTSLPARVRNLALEITAGQATLYDRVHAIEQYLRRIPYTLALPAPPYGVDIVDYFLFDLKRGYCDYLASAMVVLSRAAGIPARLATGYVSDNYDPTRARFTITKADAHSWPEIYFPDIGWVGFEPSGRLKLPGDIPSSVEPGQRSQETNPVPAPPSEADQASSKGRFPNVWVWGLIVLGLIPVSVWIGLSMERLWITRLPPLLGLETIYQRLRRSSQRFGLAVPAGVTPLELVEAFRTWGVAQGSLRKSPGNMDRMIARASSDMTALVGRYVMAVYSPAAPGKITLRWAIRTWQNLRWRLWRIATALWLYRYIFNCGHQTHPTRGETSPATRNPAARP
jgi:transglutaminase-like putative cysteine protease